MGTRADSNTAPYVIVERAFWACPTSVFTGFTFLLAGLTIGVLIGVAV